MTGAKIVRAGDEHGTTPEQVRDAITPRTAALFLPAHLDDLHNTVPLPTFSAIAREHGLPTLVDAAHMCWPLENLTRYSREGADLVCFSAKYFGGPNAAGFIAGKRALITAVTYNDFIQFETSKYNTYGRPLKMDRHTIAATVLALEEWLTMDHEERWATYHRMVKNMHRQLEGISGITLEQLYYTMEEQLIPSPVNSLVVYFAADAKVDAKTAAAALAAANPSILVNVEPDNKLIICVDVAEEGEETIIAESLRAVLCA
jgi:L-seryl-tRNA(Ser) seleniumtransferase